MSSNKASFGKAVSQRPNRRQFVATTGMAAAAFIIMKPELVRGTQANSKLRLGLVGCGGRGVWIADLFRKHGGYEFVAGADYFADKVNAFGEAFKIDPSRRYTGLSGYKRLLEKKPDAIVIESPPYFHPEQAAAGIEAGAHVYLAKPIAVDVPGCETVAQNGKKATEKKLCFLVDFQTRTDPFYKEAVKRAQYGDIGPIISGESVYVCDSTWGPQARDLRKDPKDAENRLRAWGLDRELSGDVITEQNIHSLDVTTWILDDQPIKAVGTGGQKGRDVGTCWDHFSVIFTFPKEIVVSFTSKQLGQGADDIMCRMYGSDGTIDTHYSGEVNIKGKNPYKGGKAENLYENGAVRNIATFHDNITKERFANTTVLASVRSNLTTILGRMAAYRHGEASWEEMMKKNEKWDPQLDGLKD
jgi:myo-inositol 2-dehydrogenase/D-chiro-inositol 1-dehydrogenase